MVSTLIQHGYHLFISSGIIQNIHVMRWGIIDANFTRGSNTRGANDGGISLEELRLEVPRTALEYLAEIKVSRDLTAREHIEGRHYHIVLHIFYLVLI